LLDHAVSSMSLRMFVIVGVRFCISSMFIESIPGVFSTFNVQMMSIH
jgi:hypothetical protein